MNNEDTNFSTLDTSAFGAQSSNQLPSNKSPSDQSTSAHQSGIGMSTSSYTQSNPMTGTNIIDLSQLTSLTTIYQKLMSGFHITENDLILWQSLDQHLSSYQALFSGLGYNLIKDARGYFYFSTPDTSVTMTKTSRRIALFLYTLIEFWADKGYDPVAALFEQTLSRDTFEKLFHQNASIYEQIDITSPSDIRNEVIKRMVRLGFAKEIGKEYKLLAPCYRYIDAVMELSDKFSMSDSPLDDEDEQATLVPEENQ